MLTLFFVGLFLASFTCMLYIRNYIDFCIRLYTNFICILEDKGIVKSQIQHSSTQLISKYKNTYTNCYHTTTSSTHTLRDNEECKEKDAVVTFRYKNTADRLNREYSIIKTNKKFDKRQANIIMQALNNRQIEIPSTHFIIATITFVGKVQQASQIMSDFSNCIQNIAGPDGDFNGNMDLRLSTLLSTITNNNDLSGTIQFADCNTSRVACIPIQNAYMYTMSNILDIMSQSNF
jgi:hypothetical protein